MLFWINPYGPFLGEKQLRRGNSHLGSASQDPEAFQEDPREEAEGGPPGERHGRRDQAGNLPDINTPEIAHPHPWHLSWTIFFIFEQIYLSNWNIIVLTAAWLL